MIHVIATIAAQPGQRNVRHPSHKTTLSDGRARLSICTTITMPAESCRPITATSIHFELTTNRRSNSH